MDEVNYIGGLDWTREVKGMTEWTQFARLTKNVESGKQHEALRYRFTESAHEVRVRLEEVVVEVGAGFFTSGREMLASPSFMYF